MATTTHTPSSTTAPPAPRTGRVVPVLIGAALLVKSGGFAWDYLSYFVSSGTHHGTTAAGAALTVFGIGWCVGQVITGQLTDRVGQRAALTVMLLLSAAASCALALASTLPELLTVALFLGLTMEAHRPGISAAINTTIDTPAGRTRAQTMLYWATNVGVAVCGGVGGWAAADYGYRRLFLINALVCLIFVAVANRVLPARTHGPRPADARTTYRAVLADPALRWAAVVSIFAMTCGWGLQSVLPLLMANDQLPPTSYGRAMVANTAAVLILAPVLMRLLVGRGTQARVPLVPALATGSGLLGLGITLAATQHTTIGYVIAAIAQVPGEICYTVGIGAFLSTVPPAGTVGRYQAVVSSAGAMASLPPLGIALALHTGGRPLVAALLSACALIAIAACRPLARALHTRQTTFPVLEPEPEQEPEPESAS